MIDPQTNEVIALRADRVIISKESRGVTLSDAQYKDLVDGKPVKVEGMTSKNGKSFDATLQVNAERKGIEFIFGDNKSLKELQDQQQRQQQTQGGVPECSVVWALQVHRPEETPCPSFTRKKERVSYNQLSIVVDVNGVAIYV